MHDQPKDLLLARLATARAGLFGRLLALDEDTLTTRPVDGDWTAKDILAHVAAWDQLHAERVAEIIAGRSEAIRPTGDREALNAVFWAERRDWPLERVLDEVQSARAYFLALLEGLSWADITREHAVPGSRPLTILFLTTRRAEHDFLHVRDLEAWRATTQPARAPGPKALLVDALEAGHGALLAWHDAIPAAERTARPICGAWTWQDVLGHLADWERFFVAGLGDMAQGRPAGLGFDGDEDAWNRDHAAARPGEPFEKTWDDFRQARRDLLDVLMELDDAALARPVDTPIDWLRRAYFWFSAPALHDGEHVEGLEKALSQ